LIRLEGLEVKENPVFLFLCEAVAVRRHVLIRIRELPFDIFLIHRAAAGREPVPVEQPLQSGTDLFSGGIGGVAPGASLVLKKGGSGDFMPVMRFLFAVLVMPSPAVLL